MKSFLTNLFACKMLLSSNCYKFFSFLQISFTSVLEKYLILWLVVLFGESRSFAFPKFLLDIQQLPKLKLHYWENIKTTVFGSSPDWRLARRKVSRRTYLRLYNHPTVKKSNVQLLKDSFRMVMFLFCFKWNVRFL